VTAQNDRDAVTRPWVTTAAVATRRKRARAVPCWRC